MTTLDRLVALAEFYGHCEGLLEGWGKGWIGDDKAYSRLLELLHEYEYAVKREVEA
jgi:hypothetical protein